MAARKLTTRPGRVPATRAVPADGDIAASGGGRVVARRLSLEGGSFPVGQAIGDWWLAIES